MALVIDDDADTREMYALYLAYGGFRVAVADEDPERALEKARTLLPDVITADLPFWGSLCQTLKSDRLTSHIPVIAVTGRAMPREIEDARRSGCVSVLTKPCEPAILLQEIRRVLQRSSATD